MDGVEVFTAGNRQGLKKGGNCGQGVVCSDRVSLKEAVIANVLQSRKKQSCLVSMRPNVPRPEVYR